MRALVLLTVMASLMVLAASPAQATTVGAYVLNAPNGGDVGASASIEGSQACANGAGALAIAGACGGEAAADPGPNAGVNGQTFFARAPVAYADVILLSAPPLPAVPAAPGLPAAPAAGGIPTIGSIPSVPAAPVDVTNPALPGGVPSVIGGLPPVGGVPATPSAPSVGLPSVPSGTPGSLPVVGGIPHL